MKKVWSVIVIALILSIRLGISVGDRDPLIRNLLLFAGPIFFVAAGVVVTRFLPKSNEASDETKSDDPPASRRKRQRDRRR